MQSPAACTTCTASMSQNHYLNIVTKKVIVQQSDMIQASRITPLVDRNRLGLASIGPLDPDCASFLYRPQRG